MNKNCALIVAGIIFSIVALAHLLRLVKHSEVVIAGHHVTMCVSITALVISILLAIWMFAAACCGKNK